MAADVGYLVLAPLLNDNRRYHNGNNNSAGQPPLITRDLLGESFSDISNNSQPQELDLHLQVPTGWPENCLDLIKSREVYLQKCSSSQQNRPVTKSIKRPLVHNSNLPLKSPSTYSSIYDSVCTLDKVKSALEREKHDQLFRKKFSIPTSANSPSSSSSASIITNEVTLNLEATYMPSSSQQEGSLKLSAAGCSNCLMYVMISNENPKCPKCDSTVSLPVVKKKPRIDIDLNLYL